MEIKKVSDTAFRTYGRIITGFQLDDLLSVMEHTPLPEDVVYVPSVPQLESLPFKKEAESSLFGQMPIQIGYCNGHNHLLNAVEYHRNSEVNIAAADLVLILGRQQDIMENNSYDTSLMEAFFLPAGTCVELYATTLHYAPCNTGESGFRCVVILPEGTNTQLLASDLMQEEKSAEDRLLFAKNKWLIGHPEGGLPKEAFIGLLGENRSVH